MEVPVQTQKEFMYHHRSVRFSKERTATLYTLLCYMFMICLILIGSVMWHYISGFWFPSSNMIRIPALLIAVLLMFMSPRYSKKEFIGVLLILLYLLVYGLSSLDKIASYAVSYMIPMVVCILMLTNMLKDRRLWVLLNAYSSIMFWIAIVSLFFWLFGSILHILPGAKTISYLWASRTLSTKTYFYIYFENRFQSISLFGTTVARNTALWTEAPGYTGRLTYALLIELGRRRSRKSRFRISVLVLTMLSTLSSKAFVILLEIVVVLLLGSLREKYRNSRASRMIAIVLLLILACAIFYVVYLSVIQRGTYLYRLDSALSGIRAWRENLLFGTGYRNTEQILTYSELDRVSNGISMGLTTLLGQGGIYLTAFVLYPYFRLNKLLKGTGYYRYFVIVGLTSFTDLLISNIYRTSHYMLLISLGYAILILLKTRRHIINAQLKQDADIEESN